MSKYIIRTVHIVEVPDDAGFNAADIFDDPDYFIKQQAAAVWNTRSDNA